MFRKSNINKSFSLKSLNREKEAGINFVSFCQSRNMVGQFKKVYLHRPIKILQISHNHEDSKMFNKTSKYFSFSNNKPLAS